MNEESLLAQFEMLLPLAAAWATEQGQKILGEGLPLFERELDDAHAIGVHHSNRVRLLRVTTIPRPPNGVEEVPAMLSRLLEGHEIIIEKVREGIRKTAQSGDDGTNDLLMSDVLRRHELQVWFLAEHLVDTPAVRA